MRPTLNALSKASRFPLKSKHANKDYYKGNRQSFPEGVGFRTGPPGRHANYRGKAGKSNFIIDDKKVRIFIGPGFESENSSVFKCSDLRPFAHTATKEGQGIEIGLPGTIKNRVQFYEDLNKRFNVGAAAKEIKTDSGSSSA
ncbi:hypothetical protein [Phaffia rhodozyma]|uniref:Uncharacterized protein n=1 Tax=Phaffia rhodozyma TaxID=264483 RepID=A0A0F7SE61_PHARH|nr:hypothetical protein [Phaffia rhodozyma]